MDFSYQLDWKEEIEIHYDDSGFHLSYGELLNPFYESISVLISQKELEKFLWKHRKLINEYLWEKRVIANGGGFIREGWEVK